MKVKESIWHEAAKADKNDRTNRSNDDTSARRQTINDQTNAASKARSSDSPAKEETKFSNLLESPAKLQKPNQHEEDSSEQRRDDKKERKHADKEKDSARLDGANNGKAEKYESSGGQTGGQSGFNMGANLSQLNLSENFAARSILHIADLERLVSTVRSQINLKGRREIVLQLKRSVLEGLQVKITTGAATGVAVEFLAANETVRDQIAGHAPELAGILRGRGINLDSLTVSLGDHRSGQNSSDGEREPLRIGSAAEADELSTENTFGAPLAEEKIYQA